MSNEAKVGAACIIPSREPAVSGSHLLHPITGNPVCQLHSFTRHASFFILSFDTLPVSLVSLSVPANQPLKKGTFLIIALLSFRFLYSHMEHMIKRVLRGSEDVKF